MASHENLKPVIFESLKGYSLKLFKKDLFAGITVGIVAIPLALAFAIASGATPSQGIFTAVIAGFLISFLGGSRYQIGGPTGAFVIIVYGIIAEYGYDGLLLATIMAGIILIFLGLFILFFSFLIEIIPMAALAGVLLVVSVDMMGLKNMKSLFSAPKSDILVLLTTFILTIIVDLTAAVQVGVVLAALLFMKRMSDVTSMGKINFDASEAAAKENYDPDATSNKVIPEGVEVYEINGPFFFGVADMLINTLEHIGKTPKVFILRMRNVPAIDATGEHALENFYNTCKKLGISLVLSGVNKAPYETLKKMHFIDMIGKENVLDHIDKALVRTNEILNSMASK